MDAMAFQRNLEFWKKSLAVNWPITQSSQDSQKMPGHYDLVLCPVNEQGAPILWNDSSGHSFIAAFTKDELIFRILRGHTLTELSKTDCKTGLHGQIARQFMLGDLITRFQDAKHPTVICLNPIKITPHDGHEYIVEEIIFCPIMDPISKKLMTTTDEALALLAISHEDMARFGIEIVFHLITNDRAPEDKNLRESYLKAKIQELAFMAPRIPVKRGSGSVLCVMLILDNLMEEMAFIRHYKTLDPYADVLFVTSNLELLDGDMNVIPYDGSQIDTIFSPIIEWQRTRHHYLT
ncbi:MAG: hypothetical protein A2X86_03555 [Bdellovibrionales bacterium GWA2_49_15]|nr:MAG: hypothetical protein A2X86_03555 [Bdellovibrionales bacterium GWA2_49_15]HAZ12292.1 hypothetical protein [Bdellovibrionales bacterium]